MQGYVFEVWPCVPARQQVPPLTSHLNPEQLPSMCNLGLPVNLLSLLRTNVLSKAFYENVVKILDEGLEDTVKEFITKQRILRAFETRKKGKGAFLRTAVAIRLNMVPLNMRHLINVAPYHSFGKMEFNLNFCDAVKGEWNNSVSFL